MKEHKRTEEQQKDLIFKIFSEWRDSTCSDRTQTYFSSLCEKIYEWYKDYRPKQVYSTGTEIAFVIDNFMNKDKKLNIPKDKDGFFKYLNTSLSNKKRTSYHEFNENDTIKIPREEKRKRKEIEDLIEMLESHLGRKSTSDEKIQFISKWKKVTDKKATEYLELINNKNVSSLDVKNNNDEERNILDTLDTEKLKKPLFPSYKKPDSVFFENIDVSIVKEAVISVLDKKQERARPCYKALFTLFCIKNDIKELYPILDQKIIDSFHKDGKKPKQYEIYMKYHEGIDKKSAEPQAATNLRDFINDIKTFLKEKTDKFSPKKP